MNFAFFRFLLEANARLIIFFLSMSHLVLLFGLVIDSVLLFLCNDEIYEPQLLVR